MGNVKFCYIGLVKQQASWNKCDNIPCACGQVSGHISILDDCTFQVTGFNYDGKAPAAHWWGGSLGLEQDQLR